MHLAPFALALLALTPLASAQHPIYAYDDGEAEQAYGLPAGGDLAWFQCFDTGDHSLAVDELVLVGAANGWAGLTSGADVGSAGGYAIYQEPADDCDPTDLTGADLLATVSWTVAEKDTELKEMRSVCSTAFVSGKFWVCAWVAHDPGETPAALDTDTPSGGRSWATGHLISFDPTKPNDNTNVPFVEMGAYSPLYDGVWLMQANWPDTVIRVDANATGQGNGTTWQDGFTELQEALCTARSGDEVWVADGTYQPDEGGQATPLDRAATFLGEVGVALYGGFGGGETEREERAPECHTAILTGDLKGDDSGATGNRGDNSYNVVLLDASTDATTIVDGFDVRRGNADGPVWSSVGGGIHLADTDAVVRNCTLRDNNGDEGGGMSIRGSAAPLIERCVFVSNRSRQGNGGGLWVRLGADPVVRLSSFFGNRVSFSFDVGGGAYVDGSDASFVNCLFSGNWGGGLGGGLYVFNSTTSVLDCTFAGNSADGSGGLHLALNADVTAANSVFWGNSDDDGTLESSQITVAGNATGLTLDYCDVQGLTGGLGGAGNLGVDPLFVDANGVDAIAGTVDDDLRLGDGSLCENAGDDASVPTGLDEDLDGYPRIFGAAVDLGGYERRGDCGLTYCTAGSSSAGCQAFLCASGVPSATASSGFVVAVDTVQGGMSGMFFYGIDTGPKASNWGTSSSYRCVEPPVVRAGLESTGGSSGTCDGSVSKDFNDYWRNAPPAKVPGCGSTVYMQFWYRDPQSTSNQTTGFSNALQFKIEP
jgi:hypothetical protein